MTLRVTHIITGLDVGGAEMMLLKLIQATPDIRHSVISLRGRGRVAPMIEACGATMLDCGPAGSQGSAPLTLLHITRLLKQSRPDIVQGWMYHGNLAASLARPLALLRTPVAWSIRTIVRKHRERPLTRLILYAGVPFSHGTDAILYNSEQALKEHEAIGYARHGHVVANGFDTERFRPAPLARAAMRAALGIASDKFVIGFVGRLVAAKDLPTFFAAAAQMASERHDVAIVAVGRDLPRVSTVLPQTAADIAALGNRLHLLPETQDVHALIPGFDTLVLASVAEGFPNVIGEAMACGMPCIATDVGACRSLVADTGMIVPPRDPKALAGAMRALADMPPDTRAELGARARARIVENFSLGAIADVYKTIWMRLAAVQKRAQ